MKIRIKGNSVRYRLTKTEVEIFCSTGYFTEQTKFKNSIFSYALKAKENIAELDADFTNGTITLFFPLSEKDSWADSPKVGFQNTITLDDGEELFLLLEKDFACLDETIEDQSDNYPNPQAN